MRCPTNSIPASGVGNVGIGMIPQSQLLPLPCTPHCVSRIEIAGSSR